jgi:EAL domain-containing protein (putative c-di-GMP-specific phosphodiesterase class I)
MEIVRAIAGLAHNLGLDIVAEGIEQPEQVTLLRDVRCEYGQGFFFSKPVVDTEILSRIEELGEAKNKVTPIGIA